jgi:hypothetical protein
MSNYFIYSVLQYKHSLALGEILNVGILFYFPADLKFEFVTCDSTRAKLIYPDFNNSLYGSYFKAIKKKVVSHVDLFTEQIEDIDFSQYVHKYILAADAAGLVFREPVRVKNVFGDNQIAINEYSKLLLPGVNVQKPKIEKHNEFYILKTFTNYLSHNNISIDKNLGKSETIKTKHFNIKFDFSWHNTSKNFIKPLSFDLNEENSIQNKAAIFYSYITDLKSSSNSKRYNFDFLIAKPQDESLIKPYENALDFISSATGNRRLIFEEDLPNYSQEVIDCLLLT